MLEIETPHGPSRAHLHPVTNPRAALVLGHGAGGGVGAPDLVAATTAALAADVTVALVEQLRASDLRELALLVGGRSSGARVACRTAAATDAAGVLCLAFPLRPPGRESAPSRLSELDAVTVPTLVVQGERDPFGIPTPSELRTVVLVPGNHSLRAAQPVAAAVGQWLSQLL